MSTPPIPSTQPSPFTSDFYTLSEKNFLPLMLKGSAVFVALTALQGSLQTGLKLLGTKFFEQKPLLGKMEYVDRWPSLCQKVQNVTSAYWERRIEGATLSSTTGIALITPMLFKALGFRGSMPGISTLWDISYSITERALGLLSANPIFSDSAVITSTALLTIPAALGTMTSLSLGLLDMLNKYRLHHSPVLMSDPVFCPKLTQDCNNLLEIIRNTKSEGGLFPNVLFYGPPGTGKTMVSKWLTRNSHMNYCSISGGDLVKNIANPEKNPVDIFHNHIEHLEKLSSPSILFIDEPEACFKTQSQSSDPGYLALLNAFLDKTSNQSSKVMIILSTNHPEHLDPAVISRMDYKWAILLPELLERESIIKKSIDILYTTKPEKRACFSPALVHYIASHTQGFSGRDLFKLINRMTHKTLINRSTAAQEIQSVVEQEQQLWRMAEQPTTSPLEKNPFYIPTTSAKTVPYSDKPTAKKSPHRVFEHDPQRRGAPKHPPKRP